MIIPFGRYKGKRVRDVPIEYINWYLSQSKKNKIKVSKSKWRRIFGIERFKRGEKPLSK